MVTSTRRGRIWPNTHGGDDIWPNTDKSGQGRGWVNFCEHPLWMTPNEKGGVDRRWNRRERGGVGKADGRVRADPKGTTGGARSWRVGTYSPVEPMCVTPVGGLGT